MESGIFIAPKSEQSLNELSQIISVPGFMIYDLRSSLPLINFLPSAE